MKEVNNLLNRLGELDDAPLIWVNKKVYDMAEEIERLKRLVNKDYTELNILELKKFDYEQRISKAMEYIENNFISYEDSRTFGQLGEEIDIEVKEIRELLNILKGVDKE